MIAMCLPAIQRSFLIAWKVLLEGLSTSNAHSLWPIRIDIFAVLMKKAALQSLRFSDP